jgi:uncharacterized protein (TIGR02145 family)
MRTSRKLFLITLPIFVLLLALTNCRKDDGNDKEIVKEKITGTVQKGPFINGAQVLVAELNSALGKTGKTFSTEVSNGQGYYEISDLRLKSAYLEISASGVYFNESIDSITQIPLTLKAISDVKEQSLVNVNVLTHLEKPRVEYLVKSEKKDFKAAKLQAQKEVLAVFRIISDQIDLSEKLNIVEESEGSAILLAISVILQGQRNVTELTDLMKKLSAQLETDGLMTDNDLMHDLRASALKLNREDIRRNLEYRYETLGSEVHLPDFEKYIEIFIGLAQVKPTAETHPATEVKALDAVLNGVVNPGNLSTIVSFDYGFDTTYSNTVYFGQNPVDGSENIPVAVELSGLIHDTTYYFRIKAENDLGIAYGSALIFNTMSGEVSLITQNITDITLYTAVSGGHVVNDGGSEVTVKGVCWSTSPSPTLENDFTEDGAGIGSYISELTNLTLATTYYLRSYAINAVGISYGAEKEFITKDGIVLLSTNEVTDITISAAVCGGNITSDGGSPVISRGIVWSTSESPTVDNNIGMTNEGTGTGVFTSNLTELEPLTTYYVRAYAANSIGTYYGDQMEFITNLGIDGEPCPGMLTVTDIDGNVYNTVAIGTQCWLKENLKTNKYRNGISIEYPGNDDNAWLNNTNGAYAWYNNNITWKESYGALYNFYAGINPNGLCPEGWHVPGDGDWTKLLNYVVGKGYPNESNNPQGASNALKSCRQEYSPLGGDCNTSEHPRWLSHAIHYGFDAFGFSALPGSYRTGYGPFPSNLGYFGAWWSSSEVSGTSASSRSMTYFGNVSQENSQKRAGYSVRCLRD